MSKIGFNNTINFESFKNNKRDEYEDTVPYDDEPKPIKTK